MNAEQKLEVVLALLDLNFARKDRDQVLHQPSHEAHSFFTEKLKRFDSVVRSIRGKDCKTALEAADAWLADNDRALLDAFMSHMDAPLLSVCIACRESYDQTQKHCDRCHVTFDADDDIDHHECISFAVAYPPRPR